MKLKDREVDESIKSPLEIAAIEAEREQSVCRICRTHDPDKPLKAPCLCTGSIKFVHSDCLIEWINYSKKEVCHVCKQKYKIQKLFAELSYWEIGQHLLSYCVHGLSIAVSLTLWTIGFPIVVNYIFQVFSLPSTAPEDDSKPLIPSFGSPHRVIEYLLSDQKFPLRWSFTDFARAYYYGVFQSFILIGLWMMLLSLRDIVLDFMDLRSLRAVDDFDAAPPLPAGPPIPPVLDAANNLPAAAPVNNLDDDDDDQEDQEEEEHPDAHIPERRAGMVLRNHNNRDRMNNRRRPFNEDLDPADADLDEIDNKYVVEI
jgi:hypothetical protein